MPFMIGPNPVLRTWKYLESGKIYLKDRIKIFIIHYCTGRNYYPRHQGARYGINELSLFLCPLIT